MKLHLDNSTLETINSNGYFDIEIDGVYYWYHETFTYDSITNDKHYTFVVNVYRDEYGNFIANDLLITMDRVTNHSYSERYDYAYSIRKVNGAWEPCE